MAQSNGQAPTQMTFFARFEDDILAGKKTITIRDYSESHYQVGSIVDVYTLEANQWFCQLKILNVQPIEFESLTSIHAQQENMTLSELKQVISEIYPNQTAFYVIGFELIQQG